MSERTDLLIIDPQVSFCDPDKGELYVPGAEQDMERVASLVDRYGGKINKIHVTLDCHHKIDVAHPGMWRNSDGEHPDPFTIITSQDIKDGVWYPIFPSLRQRFTKYCEDLEAGGRYPLCIWPEHCLIGSQGNNVLPVLYEALTRWEEKKKNNVNFVSKGSNIYTEHFGIIMAEVPDPEDPSTQINAPFIKTLEEADKIIVVGEAGSHCLKFSVEDISDAFSDDSYIQKIVLLTDGTSPVISPVVDFPIIQNQFIENMKKRGMKVAKTTDF